MRKTGIGSVLLAVMLLFSSAALSEYAGSWNTVTGEPVSLVLGEDGEGTLDMGDGGKTVLWQEGENGLSIQEGGQVYNAVISDQFLMLMDQIGHVWALTRDLYDLPEIVRAQSEADFSGTWKADYALVSGIRIDMEALEGPYIMEIEPGVVHLSFSGMEKKADWLCRFEDGVLILNGYTPEGDQTLHLRADGSLTRDMEYMVIHFVLEQ